MPVIYSASQQIITRNSVQPKYDGHQRDRNASLGADLDDSHRAHSPIYLLDT
jgi:hypothetical protein